MSAIIILMCGRCEGDPYRGVKALFNGDLQASIECEDRRDWLVVSDEVIVYLGTTALSKEVNPLFRGCEVAIDGLNNDERMKLNALSRKLSRPAFGAS